MENNPKIVRDQIRGLRKMIKIYGIEKIQKSIPYITEQFSLSVSKIENTLKHEEKNNKIPDKDNTDGCKMSKSCLDRNPNYYDKAVSP